MARASEHLSEIERELLSLASTAQAVRVERPEAGQDNAIALVDDRWVVRIARTADARSYHETEVALLGALEGHRVPQLRGALHHGIVYEYIPGARLTPSTWAALSGRDRRTAATDLSEVLRALHALPTETIPDSADLLDRTWVLDSIERCHAVEPRAPLPFDPVQLADRFEAAWSSSDDPTSIIHVDLKPDNLVVDGDRASIIDFGAACLGDPAIDYGVLTHHFGPGMLDAMGITDPSLTARARCYADLYHLRRCTRGWTRSAAMAQPAPVQ